MKTQILVVIILVALLAILPVPAAGETQAVDSNGPFNFSQAYFDRNLDYPTSVAVSPDGEYLYVPASDSDRLAVFSRDPLTGELSLVEMKLDGIDGVDGLEHANDVAMSPDGSHVYVAGTWEDALAVFSRDPNNGKLTFVEMLQDGVDGVDSLDGIRSVTVSLDGKYVYTAASSDNALTAFTRDIATGELTFLDKMVDGVDGVDGLGGASSVVVSPEGKHIYVIGHTENAVAVFNRHSTTGLLTFVEMVQDGVGGVDGLEGARGVTISPDGKHVYTTGYDENAVTAFRRDPSTGELSFLEVAKSGSGGVFGLRGAYDVSVSPDGLHLYVAAEIDDAVAIFTRNASNGSLTFVERVMDEYHGVDGLNGATSIGFNPVDDQVYLVGFYDNAVVTFLRDQTTGELSWLDMWQSVNGLEGTVGAAMSSDGHYLLVTGNKDDSVVVFERDPASRRLIWVQTEQDGVYGADGLDGARAVAISPDGEYVYVAGSDEDSVAIFHQESVNGRLSDEGMVQDSVDGVDGLDGPQALTVSPDGRHLYVASQYEDAVAIFSRDAASGALTFVGMVKDGIGGVDGLNGAYDVAVSPDGKYLYAAGYEDDAIVIFSRNSTSGVLTFKQMLKDGNAGIDGLNGVGSIALSPDGRFLYAAGRLDNAIATFSRNATSGALTFLAVHKDSDPGVDGLYGARGIACSPDGTYVAVASQFDNALAIFSRNADNGALTFLQVFKDGVDGVNGLNTADGLAITPDSREIFVSGYNDNAVAVFRREFTVFLPFTRR